VFLPKIKTKQETKMKQLLILLSLLFIFSCGGVDIDEVAQEQVQPEIEKVEVNQVQETVETVAMTAEEKLATIPQDTYTLPNDFDFSTVTFNSPIEGEFNIKYYEFKNQVHPNGYVVIYEYSVAGGTYKVLSAVKPAVYIALVDNGIQAIEIEVVNSTSSMRTTLKNLSSRDKSLFRTCEAIIICSLRDSAFTVDDVKKVRLEMEGRMQGQSR
jgi:hypothetical protein